MIIYAYWVLGASGYDIPGLAVIQGKGQRQSSDWGSSFRIAAEFGELLRPSVQGLGFTALNPNRKPCEPYKPSTLHSLEFRV